MLNDPPRKAPPRSIPEDTAAGCRLQLRFAQQSWGRRGAYLSACGISRSAHFLTTQHAKRTIHKASLYPQILSKQNAGPHTETQFVFHASKIICIQQEFDLNDTDINRSSASSAGIVPSATQSITAFATPC